jgi:hypothetical protein
MSSYVKAATEAGDQFLAMLAAYQDFVLEYYASALTYSGGTVPVSRSSLSTMHELYKVNFAFSERFLAQQKAYLDGLFKQDAPKPVRASPARSKSGKKRTRSTATRTRKRGTSSSRSRRSSPAK